MVLDKENNRADYDCIYFFNLRRAQDANFVFHQSSCCRAICMQAHQTRWSFLQATLGDRIVLRISGQLDEPHTLNPHKSTMMNDLIKSSSQKNTERSNLTLCHVKILRFMLNVDALENLQNHKNSEVQETARIPRISERSWSATSRTSSTKCARTNKDTRTHEVRAYDRDQFKGVHSIQGGGAATQWKRRHLTSQPSEPFAEQWSSWFSWTWSLSSRSSWWDSSSSHPWRQITLTYLI